MLLYHRIEKMVIFAGKTYTLDKNQMYCLCQPKEMQKLKIWLRSKTTDSLDIE